MGVYFVEMSALSGRPPAQKLLEQDTWDVLFADAYGAGGGGGYNAETLNRAWHAPTAQWVFWQTTDPDTTGASYPGPGVFGECTNYGVETIVYVPA